MGCIRHMRSKSQGIINYAGSASEATFALISLSACPCLLWLSPKEMREIVSLRKLFPFELQFQKSSSKSTQQNKPLQVLTLQKKKISPLLSLSSLLWMIHYIFTSFKRIVIYMQTNTVYMQYQYGGGGTWSDERFNLAEPSQ